MPNFDLCCPTQLMKFVPQRGLKKHSGRSGYHLLTQMPDKSQLIETHNISTLQTNSNLNQDHSPKQSTTFCSTCGSFVGENPLVTEGLIPKHLSSIFAPIQAKLMTARRKLVTKARVITSNVHVQKLYEKVEEEKRRNMMLKKERLRGR
uniref:Uncharacterized protein n=1 Tax=Magallana gigas TaxID=29159 RepID=K1S1B3_MAGGI